MGVGGEINKENVERGRKGVRCGGYRLIRSSVQIF
jgi:hypothetical protein